MFCTYIITLKGWQSGYYYFYSTACNGKKIPDFLREIFGDNWGNARIITGNHILGGRSVYIWLWTRLNFPFFLKSVMHMRICSPVEEPCRVSYRSVGANFRVANISCKGAEGQGVVCASKDKTRAMAFWIVTACATNPPTPPARAKCLSSKKDV